MKNRRIILEKRNRSQCVIGEGVSSGRFVMVDRWFDGMGLKMVIWGGKENDRNEEGTRKRKKNAFLPAMNTTSSGELHDSSH